MTDVIKPHWQSIAEEYDELSLWNKGERQAHFFYLEALLRLKKGGNGSFLELGCGTGYFTTCFFKVFPDIDGILVDGSSEMLTIAANRIREIQGRATYLCKPLQEIVPSDFNGHFDIIFSALTIHHLVDEDKKVLFEKIYDCLQFGGNFILYDIAKSVDTRTAVLLEQLSCLHMQARLKTVLNLDVEFDELSLDSIMSNDRANKIAEGDSEASVEDQVHWLKEVGFVHVCIFYQENRFFGAIATK